MRVESIYYSLNGEGVHALIPSAIVRLQGCNLKCTWCDTAYSLDPTKGTEMSVESVLEAVSAVCAHPRWVLLTGGEPLLQELELLKLVKELKRRGIKIEVETNGSFEAPIWWKLVDSWSADIKCPSSGMYGRSLLSWLDTRERDQVKFVVANEEDLECVRSILVSHYIAPTVLISPVYPWNNEWLRTCAEFCKTYDTRMSLQQHKIIYGKEKNV